MKKPCDYLTSVDLPEIMAWLEQDMRFSEGQRTSLRAIMEELMPILEDGPEFEITLDDERRQVKIKLNSHLILCVDVAGYGTLQLHGLKGRTVGVLGTRLLQTLHEEGLS